MIKNIEWVKIRNARKIIEHASQTEDFSKKELSEQLELSFATVSTLVNRMEDRQILEEVPTEPTGTAGRSAKRYRLRKESILFLAIAFANRSLVTMALVNLHHSVVSRMDFILGANWPEAASQMRESYVRLLETAGADDSGVVAVGASVQGSYNAQQDVLRSPYQSVLDGLHLHAELKALFGKDAVIQNDIDTATIYTSHLTKQNYFLYLYVSWQIGVGVVANGHLLSGFHGQTTEISHLPLGDNVEPCPVCGARNCISASLSKGAMLEKWYGHPFPTRPMGYESQWQDFILAVERGDARALQIVHDKSQLLANLILTLFSVCGVRTATISGIPEVLYRHMLPSVLTRLRQWQLTSESYEFSFDPDAKTTILAGAMDAAFRRWYPALERVGRAGPAADRCRPCPSDFDSH